MVIDRSAEVETPVPSVAQVFRLFESAVVEETVAVLERLAVRAGSTLTTSVIAAALFRSSSACVQLTAAALFAHDQPVPAAETNVSPAGNTSVTVGAAA